MRDMARIAVFDDNHLARQVLAGMLRIQGHEVLDYDPPSLLEALGIGEPLAIPARAAEIQARVRGCLQPQPYLGGPIA